MPIYAYKGLNKQGKDIKGNINVDSMPTAKSRLKSQGIMLVSIKEQKTKKAGGSSFSFGSGVSVNELSMMTRQLATLVKAKIQIVEALSALSDQVESEKLKLVLSEIKQKVNEGTSLAKAFGEHPKIFNNVYVNMVDAGEASGTLEIVLLRLAEFTEAQVKLKNKIAGAMTYPIIMAVAGFGLMNVVFIFVIPQIAKILRSMKKELPLPTKISIGISDFLQNYWLIVIVLSITTIFLFRYYINTEKGKSRWHAFVLKVPKIGKLVTMINVSRFCSTLGTLLNSGVPILASLNIVKNIIGNVHMKAAVEASKAAVSEGSSMSGPLMQSGHFPALVTHMIKLGENSGELEEMLKIVSENYEDQVESNISGLTAMLEPIMIIFLGLAVGFVVVSVIVPMMEMNSIKK